MLSALLVLLSMVLLAVSAVVGLSCSMHNAGVGVVSVVVGVAGSDERHYLSSISGVVLVGGIVGESETR